jgi:hypothetical protein
MSVVPPVDSRPCSWRANTTSSRRRMAARCGRRGGGWGGKCLSGSCGEAGTGWGRRAERVVALAAAGWRAGSEPVQAGGRHRALPASAPLPPLTRARSRVGLAASAWRSAPSSSVHTSSATWCWWWPSATCMGDREKSKGGGGKREPTLRIGQQEARRAASTVCQTVASTEDEMGDGRKLRKGAALRGPSARSGSPPRHMRCRRRAAAAQTRRSGRPGAVGCRRSAPSPR